MISLVPLKDQTFILQARNPTETEMTSDFWGILQNPDLPAATSAVDYGCLSTWSGECGLVLCLLNH